MEAGGLGKRLGVGAALMGAAALVYFWYLRDWHLQWGATPQEARGEVASDDLMPEPHSWLLMFWVNLGLVFAFR